MDNLTACEINDVQSRWYETGNPAMGYLGGEEEDQGPGIGATLLEVPGAIWHFINPFNSRKAAQDVIDCYRNPEECKKAAVGGNKESAQAYRLMKGDTSVLKEREIEALKKELAKAQAQGKAPGAPSQSGVNALIEQEGIGKLNCECRGGMWIGTKQFGFCSESSAPAKMRFDRVKGDCVTTAPAVIAPPTPQPPAQSVVAPAPGTINLKQATPWAIAGGLGLVLVIALVARKG